MISRIQIQRMIQIGAWSRLVDRILANGRCRSLPARRRLSEEGTAAVAGLGLALQRLCEITYGPSTLAARLAQRLRRLQREDGLFTAGCSPSPAATAVAVAGLLAWREQRIAAGAGPDRGLDGAIARGIAAIAEALKRPGQQPPDRVDIEVVLWQLGRHDAFRQAVPLADLAPACVSGGRGSGGRRGDDDLTRFAAAAAA